MSIDIRDLNGYRQLPGQGGAASDKAGDSAAAERKHAAEQRAAAERAAAAEPAGADRVELSSTARNLRSLEESVQAGSGVDAARVERIRQEIAEGRYHVDADKLADRMIDLERALLD